MIFSKKSKVYSYLNDQKHCVKIKNAKNDFTNIVSVILFDIFFKKIFFFFYIASLHNFGNHNTLLSFAKSADSYKISGIIK